MSTAILTAEAPRVRPNAWHAFGGIWRLTSRRFTTLGYWIGAVALLSVLGLFTIAVARNHHSPRFFFDWARFAYLTVMLPVMVFVVTGAAVRDDLKPASVDYVFTRPLRRSAFVLFKYLSQMACLQINFLLAFGVLFAAGMYRHVPGLLAAAPLFLFAQFLLVMAFSAFGFFCGLITSRYLVAGLIYAAVVEVGVGQLPTQLSKIAMTRQVLAMLEPTISRVVPGLSSGDAPGVLATAGLLCGFALVMISLSALIFSHQELAGGQSQQS